jgi:hypothetical protein
LTKETPNGWRDGLKFARRMKFINAEIRDLAASGRFAIDSDRSDRPFRGFLLRKTTPRDLYQATVIAKRP